MNSNWLKSIVVTVAVGGLVAGASVLAAPAAGEQEGQRSGKRLENRPFLQAFFGNLGRLAELKEELNLTPEQKEQIKGIIEKHKPEIAEKLRSLQERGQKLQAAVTANTIDEQAIRAAIQEMVEPLADAAVLKAKVQHDVMAVLTEEQRQKAKEAGEDIRQNKEAALKKFEGK